MEEVQEKRLDIQIQEAEQTETHPPENEKNANSNRILFTRFKQHKKWFQMAIYSILVLSGQSSATLLGRLYYEKGGKSKYMAALVQSAGFPILLPFLYITSRKKNKPTDHRISPSNTLALSILYITFGTLLAFDCMLYAVGLMYLPVSTYSLICATQLGFNAFFSYFINSHKLTPLILNSIFLLTSSTILLIFQPDSSDANIKGKIALGFICTISGAALYALVLSLEQLAYGKVLKSQNMNAILNVIFYESMVTSCVLSLGLFGSGEWRGLKKEMDIFELGKKCYVMVLVFTALAWQIFAIGMVSLILKISSLFGNVISTLNVPVVPILGVVFFHEDKMSGLKVVAMFLAVWGFLSFIYQQFLDDVESRAEKANSIPRD